jgi:hypothetical protein
MAANWLASCLIQLATCGLGAAAWTGLAPASQTAAATMIVIASGRIGRALRKLCRSISMSPLPSTVNAARMMWEPIVAGRHSHGGGRGMTPGLRPRE